jgi:hypothetical protein
VSLLLERWGRRRAICEGKAEPLEGFIVDIISGLQVTQTKDFLEFLSSEKVEKVVEGDEMIGEVGNHARDQRKRQFRFGYSDKLDEYVERNKQHEAKSKQKQTNSKATFRLVAGSIVYITLTLLLTMIKNCWFIITVPIKVNLVRLFVGLERDDVLWEPEAVVAEVVGKREWMVLAPAENHLVDCVFVWKIAVDVNWDSRVG